MATEFRFDLVAIKAAAQRRLDGVDGGLLPVPSRPLRIRTKITVSPEFVAAALADDERFWREYFLKIDRIPAVAAYPVAGGERCANSLEQQNALKDRPDRDMKTAVGIAEKLP